MTIKQIISHIPKQHFRRWFSFSRYQYPLATEPPIITKTTAAKQEVKTTVPVATTDKEGLRDPKDPFDDSRSLSDLEVDSIRKMQNKFLTTELKGSTAIGLKPPPEIPQLMEANTIPETQITTLENGVRVVSQETYGQVCSIGVLADLGSRNEHQLGSAHLLELMAFQSTPQYRDSVEIQQHLQDWGGTSFANSSREQSLWCLDILRPNVEKGMDLLKQTTLEPLLQDWEIEDSKLAMQYQAMETIPEIHLGEALQVGAYGMDQQLGKPHFAPLDAVSNLNASSLREFLDINLWKNPKGIVIAGAGIGHDELVDMAKLHYGSLKQETKSQYIPSTYHGGMHTFETATIDGMTRVGIGLEVGGWHSDDLVPGCVLQTLLGGGSSFSAGGPGKGMYSRLYRQVLNRYYWADAAEAFTMFHHESGLIGISGSSKGDKSRDLARVITEHLLRLAVDLVSDEELERARNMLKNNVLTQLESRLVLFEDMGRQVLTYGRREGNADMTAKIDAVTKEDLRELMIRALKKPPTCAAVGDDVSKLPPYSEVNGWFK
mmetsp:Transcript_27148/g.40100  ORF Transcript_27148/g.40100 Transcript_27148/m.40100 type:complete len:547 (+) Transcript_27148:207-1847(+)|eukprot:CAMPEP_0194215964 /NCGR_PEP_ID=MMETSP0156-20130528/18123_1 /TAXON_ID=33649 /ORGANISM="Thalassionema nitzschioides, Strain L26-B" /LENGTH=546 /DNA_ID=CAMNT_0038944617 /DNA_START=111 /DNA_END=1751 /DNA_ORIENTATION=-